MKKKINFIKPRKIFFIISAAFIALTIVLAPFRTQLSIQFSGGSIASYPFTESIHKIDLAEFGSVIENAIGQEVTITTSTDFISGRSNIIATISKNNGLDDDATTAMHKAVMEKYSDYKIGTPSVENVNASMGREFFIKCLVALFAAMILIIIYIGFRFRKIGGFSAGVFAICSLIHDSIFVYLTFLVFGFPIDSNFIAVVLTILGYSVNNTIVIYDRIREDQGIYGRKMSIREIVNLSINNTLGRTICTSAATIFAILAIAVVAMVGNIESINSFAVPLLVGMIAGTYSSICISTNLWVLWKERKKTKKVSK